MVTQNPNPFILPGFGQSGDTIQNPMLASMEMMRKAWEGLASTGGFERMLATPGISPEDLERRITDLRAVENWLRMNLSMLSSTIQALEVQRATVSTLQAFVASTTGAANPAPSSPSPLDIALGIQRGAEAAPSADSSGLFGDKASTASAKADTKPATPAGTTSAADTPVAHEGGATAGVAEGVIQTWWDMLQTQFDNLASATTATLQGAEAVQDAATAAQHKAVDSAHTAADVIKKSTAAKTAFAPEATPTPAKKTATKKAAKKTSAKKTATQQTDSKSTRADNTEIASKPAAARKSAAKKATAKNATAKKATVKKTASKKTASKQAIEPDAT